VSEQRYQAVLAVIAEGCTVTEVAARWGVSRQTLHAWLAKYEAGGLENLGDGSHRPVSCPHQMAAEAEVVMAELRRAHPSCGSNPFTTGRTTWPLLCCWAAPAPGMATGSKAPPGRRCTNSQGWV